MSRFPYIACLVFALLANGPLARGDERADAALLLREALAALTRAEASADPRQTLAELEAASALVARLTREHAGTYVGLRLASGQPIGHLDPADLERRLAAARAAAGPLPRPQPAAAGPAPAGRPRPCERGATPLPGRRPGDALASLAEVIADCRTALAFEPSSARYRFQLARVLSERAQPGDREEALRLLEAAAEAGHTAAKAELCARYHWGIGTAKDAGRARVLCAAAAGEGSEQAKALLGQGGLSASVQR